MPQRAPRQLGFDLIEAQCALALSVPDLEAFEVQRRAQSGPMRLYFPDAHRTIDCGTEHSLDIAAVAFDLRQDRVAQGQQQHSEGEVAQRDAPDERAQHNAQPGVGWQQMAQTGTQARNDGLGGSWRGLRLLPTLKWVIRALEA